MKIIIDPSLVWFDEKPETSEKFKYLYLVMDFIDKYLNVNILTSKETSCLLLTLIKDPFSEYRETTQRKNEIIQKIWSHLDDSAVELDDNIFKLENIKNSSSDKANELFCKKLNYAIKNNIECLLFLSLDNQKNVIKTTKNIKIVKHIYKEVGSNIAELFSQGNNINMNNFLQPTKENPLPNVELCKRYTQIRNELIMEGKTDVPIYLELGKEVAYRNGYEKDINLTKINNSAIREIFRKNIKNSWYLSTDVEHGAIEVCDEKGKHIDEYTYEGKAQNKKDISGKHDISLKK